MTPSSPAQPDLSPDNANMTPEEWNAAVQWLDTAEHRESFSKFAEGKETLTLEGFSSPELVAITLGTAEEGSIAVVFATTDEPDLVQVQVNRRMIDLWAKGFSYEGLGFRRQVLVGVACRFVLAIIHDVMVNGDPDAADAAGAPVAEGV